MRLRRPFEGDTTLQSSEKILFFEPPEPSNCPPAAAILLNGSVLETQARDGWALRLGC